ncbi:MAG: energy-coupling factor ABC transporter permease [Methanomethylovorans sp.]|nr:energy-coupling factor ABC transporter permease [Methanomethylovorans sp.]
MHIFEGFLPSPWWQLWFVFSIPVIMFGMYRLNRLVRERREVVPLLAVAGAFIFVLSSLKLPSVTGSCSHPTGTGMAAVLFGPAITSVLGLIVLIYQALFLAHGGISTLGANVASMGIIGPFTAYMFYKTAKKMNMNFYLNIFLATAIADWVTYVITSIQLSLAFPAGGTLTLSGFLTSFTAFAAVFATTQVPLAIIEGALTALIMKYVVQVKSDVLVNLEVLTSEAVNKLKGAMA